MTTFSRIIQYKILNKLDISDCNNSNHFQNNHIYILFFEFLNNYKKDNPHNKFKILKNVLENIFLKQEIKNDFLNIFCNTQKAYKALSKFAYIIKFKKSNIKINTDLFLNPINENSKNIIYILQNNNRFLFCLSDLINIINNSLSNSSNFFSNPLVIKNPYNNIAFNKSTLYNIYFLIKKNYNIIPILFHNFFLSNFNIKLFQINNECLLNEFSINKYIDNLNVNELVKKIKIMLKNSIYGKFLVIDKDFPILKLIETMKPFLYLYIHSNYSVNENRRIIYEKKFNYKLKKFISLNRVFGRKIININNITNKKNVSFVDSYININNDNKKNVLFMSNHIPKPYNNNLFLSDDESTDSHSIPEDTDEEENNYEYDSYSGSENDTDNVSDSDSDNDNDNSSQENESDNETTDNLEESKSDIEEQNHISENNETNISETLMETNDVNDGHLQNQISEDNKTDSNEIILDVNDNI